MYNIFFSFANTQSCFQLESQVNDTVMYSSLQSWKTTHMLGILMQPWRYAATPSTGGCVISKVIISAKYHTPNFKNDISAIRYDTAIKNTLHNV
jgi:hypothetical protein